MRFDHVGVDERNLGHTQTAKGLSHDGTNAAQANDADSKILNVLLCTDAPSFYGAPLKRIVFETL